MFEDEFRNCLADLRTDRSVIDKFWKEIHSHYSASNRYYHNLTHLDNLVDQLYPIKNEIQDWSTIILAAAYHDIIYNILKRDNEEQSASLADQRLTQLGLSEMQKNQCREHILFTKTHELSKITDTNFFTDADLSILGTDNVSYMKYAGQIRKEYKYYPDLLYNPGRKKVLKHFPQMRSIFKTSYFKEKYEDQARKNLAIELSSYR